MTIANVNVWAVLVSAVASMIVGSIWYGPLFGKPFMRAMGMDTWTKEKQDEMKKGMALTFLWQFISSIVMFSVLAWILGVMNLLSLTGGLCGAVLLWIGFVVPVQFGEQLWGGKMILFWLGLQLSTRTAAIRANTPIRH